MRVVVFAVGLCRWSLPLFVPLLLTTSDARHRMVSQGHIFYGGAGEGPGGARAPGLFDLDPALLDPARSVVVSGMSKAWAMTGFRVGWMVTPNLELSTAAAKLLEASVSCGVPFAQQGTPATRIMTCWVTLTRVVLATRTSLHLYTHLNFNWYLSLPSIHFGVHYNPPFQTGALAALECTETMESVKHMVHEYHTRRDAAVAVLKQHDLYEYAPEGAFYLLVRIQAADHKGDKVDDVQFCKELLEEEHVAVSPGSAFGDVSSGFVRVSLARDVADVVEGLQRLCKKIKSLE